MAIRVPASYAYDSQCRRDSIGMRGPCWSRSLHHKRHPPPKSQCSRDRVHRFVGSGSALNALPGCGFDEFLSGPQSPKAKGPQLWRRPFLACNHDLRRGDDARANCPAAWRLQSWAEANATLLPRLPPRAQLPLQSLRAVDAGSEASQPRATREVSRIPTTRNRGKP